jgi:large subunit ribosomal protein L3
MIKEIFGKKLGMTQIFNGEGDLVGVTLIEVEPVCLIEEVKYPNKEVTRIGFFKLAESKINKIKKPVAGYLNKMGVGPYKFIKEVSSDQTPIAPEQPEDAVSQEEGGEEGVQPKKKEKEAKKKEDTSAKVTVGIEIFSEGEIVDVRAKSKGKGFAGGMKRHNWAGQPKSHGSTTHRRIGSAGASAYPSRIIKGLRMPGHMGNAYCTTKNLKVVKIDKDKNLLFIRGSVPGSRGSIIKIRKR